jgi:hypothetical protein
MAVELDYKCIPFGNLIMVSTFVSARGAVRQARDTLIRNYFQFRVNSTPDPYKIFLSSRPFKVLFILSHMRSGSSLLAHILSSNPTIRGYGETHIQYASELDFKQLILKVYLRAAEFRHVEDLQNLTMHHRYILDKVLHNNKFLDHAFLSSAHVSSIFLLREPARSIASILDLKPHWTEDTALDYYVGRLNMLSTYAELINSPSKTFFVTYEQLLNATPLALQGIQQFLGVKHSFSEHYKVLKVTGMPGIGDHKGNIKAGQIVRNSRELKVTISSQVLEKAESIFAQCQETLMNKCSHIY